MFDFESKLRALVENYGLAYLLEDNEITEEITLIQMQRCNIGKRWKNDEL